MVVPGVAMETVMIVAALVAISLAIVWLAHAVLNASRNISAAIRDVGIAIRAHGQPQIGRPPMMSYSSAAHMFRPKPRTECDEESPAKPEVIFTPRPDERKS